MPVRHCVVLASLTTAATAVVCTPAPAAPNDLLVTQLTNGIVRLDSTSGENLGPFVPGLSRGRNWLPGPDGLWYTASGPGIYRFERDTGAFVDAFIPTSRGGLGQPWDAAFAPDGNLLVLDLASESIRRFDGASGAFIDEIVPPGAGGLNRPAEITVGDDGLLYVADRDRNANLSQIRRFDAVTGNFVDIFVADVGADVNFVNGTDFGPDGLLYVVASSSLGADRVLRYDPANGMLVDEFIKSQSDNFSSGVAFGPDGHIYLCAHTFRNGEQPYAVLRYDGNTGAFIDEFLPYDINLYNTFTVTFGEDNHLYTVTWSSSSYGARDQVRRWDSQTGAFIDVFASNVQVNGGLEDPRGFTYGPDGNLYVGGGRSNNVMRYDGQTGDLIDEFVAPGEGGLLTPRGVTFGADDNLYVASRDTGSILRYDGLTGAFIDAFVPSGSGGLIGPQDILFGPGDGHLYVADFQLDAVLRYDGITGAFIDEFVSSGSGGLIDPAGLTFGPDGHLYVAGGGVLRYDGLTGTFLDAFVPLGSGGLVNPTGVIFGPDDHLYVADWSGSAVLKYDGSTGAFLDQLSSISGGQYFPGRLLFIPEPPGPTLAVEATCPSGGPITISWSGATPDGEIILLLAREAGSFVIPDGYPCAGATLDLSNTQLQVAYRGPADPDGNRVLNSNAGRGACGRVMQLLDLTTCGTSNTAVVE